MATSFRAHYKALMTKNYTIWKRNKCGSCCEVVVPILLALLLVVFRKTITKTDVGETSYINSRDEIYAVPPSTASQIKDLGMINCWTRSYKDSPSFRNGKVALMPNNVVITNLQNIMSTYVNSEGYSFSF